MLYASRLVWQKLQALVKTIFFPSKSAKPLAAMRIGISSVLLLQALFIAPELLEIWGPSGYFQKELNQYILENAMPFMIDLSYLSRILHMSAESLVLVLFLTYAGALAALLIGFQTRVAAILSCGLHLLLKFNQGQASTYGVDSFAQMFLFYCVIFPVSDTLALDSKKNQPASENYGFALRVMQIHLCIAYASSGIAKALGTQWRSGEVIWRAFNLPQFHTVDMSWLAQFAFMAKIIAWSTLFLEIGYPLLLGWKKTRFSAAWMVIGMHAGIAALMGLASFALFMMVLTGSLFLISSEPVPEQG